MRLASKLTVEPLFEIKRVDFLLIRFGFIILTLLLEFIRTNPFKKVSQYRNAISIGLLAATNDTFRVSKIAKSALKDIYVSGIEIKKAGIILSQITNDDSIQESFLDAPKTTNKLMKTMDDINHRFGQDSIHLANTKRFINKRIGPKWVSPQYTTQWNDILRLK